jgi:glyoxylase-like metal-dependent hydrolase (beta-lactamase superfamily II)
VEPLRFGPVEVWLGDKSGKYPDGNQVIVQGRAMRVAFDTPLVANTIGTPFDSVDLVILGHVHEDHMAGLHRVPNAQVQVHEADLAAAQSWAGLSAHYGYEAPVLETVKALIDRDFHYHPRPDATGYGDGQQWDLGGVTVRAHHLPGHTRGHCALVVEEEGLAFIGDIDLTGFGPYYGDATSSLADLRRSLVRVAELEARVWVTSHHRAVLTDRAVFVNALEKFGSKIDERSEKLLRYLRERPHTLDGLARRGILYPPGHDAPYTFEAERNSARMHLDELCAKGLVVRNGDAYTVA